MTQYLRSLTTKFSNGYVGGCPAFLPKPVDLVHAGGSTRNVKHVFRITAASLNIQNGPTQRQKFSPNSTVARSQFVSVFQSTNWDPLDSCRLANALPKEAEEQATVRDSKGNRKSPLDGKPTPEQLQGIHDSLVNTLPNLFVKPLDYTYFSPDVILVDNIRGKTYRGLMNYIQQVAMLRIVGHFRYAFVKVELLNSSIDPLEGRVIIRWRIKGISGLRVFLKFWSYKLWKWRELINQQETWHDGISYYDVSGDGMVYKHTIDKVIEDKNQEVATSLDKKLRLASKLAGASSALASPIIIGTLDHLSPL